MAENKISLRLNSLMQQSGKTAKESFQQLVEVYRGQRHELPRLLNSIMLILARVSSSALGFFTWLLIARFYEANEVGIASGVTSSMMLIVQLALLGVGSALIVLFGKQEQLARLLDTAFTIVSGAALVIAGIFLLLSSLAFRELVIVSQIPLYALLFLGICLFGTVNVLFDHISIAMRRGDEVFSRNALFGIITIVGAILLPYLTGSYNSMTIIMSWVLAGLGACLLGIIQARQSKLHYLYQPKFNRSLSKDLVSIGLPNYLLTLAERTPNWIIPIAVTELMSPVDNARWYAVWMMAWVVFIVPISIGQNLFAEAARKPEAVGNSIRQSIRTALALGFVAALGVEILAYFLLWLLGPEYAAAGTTPLRILVLAVFPITIIQTYFAICRAKRRLLEATLTGLTSGILGIVMTVLAGMLYGLTSMAIAWLAVQTISSIWAFWRLNRMG